MLGISAIGTYLPRSRISNLDLVDELDTTVSFLREKIGVFQRAVKASDEDTSDLAFKAMVDLFESTHCPPESIELLVVVTQNPDGNVPHVSGRVHAAGGLADDCAAFDVSLGCSGYVYGLSVVKSFMESNGLTTGVLITADPYSKIIDRTDRNTALLFGDGATATLVSANPIWSLESFTFGSRGKGWRSICTDAGKLSMDGRAVFNFAAKTVPEDIRKLLRQTGLSLDEVDRIILHQGSRFIVETIANRLKQPLTKFPVAIESCGNTVSSSIPLILQAEMNRLETNIAILSGFGVGLSWASCLCKRIGGIT